MGGLCYGAGIGTIFPIIKLIISDEGLQGAAEIRMTESMMGVSLRTVGYTEETPVEIDGVQGYEAEDENDRGPGARVGLSPQSRILLLDGRDVSLPKFAQAIAEKKPSETVEITWLGHPDKRRHKKSIQLGKPRMDIVLLAKLSGLLPRGDDQRFRSMVYIMGAFLLVNIVQSTMRFFQDYCAGIMIERGLADLRSRVYDRALNLPLRFYSLQGGSSDITSRFIRDAPSIRRGLNLLFTQTMLEPCLS